MSNVDYTDSSGMVGGGFQGNLTISHNVGGIVLLALGFLVILRLIFNKKMV